MTPRLKCHLIVIIGTNHGRRRSSDGVTMKCCYPLLGIVAEHGKDFSIPSKALEFICYSTATLRVQK